MLLVGGKTIMQFLCGMVVMISKNQKRCQDFGLSRQ